MAKEEGRRNGSIAVAAGCGLGLIVLAGCFVFNVGELLGAHFKPLEMGVDVGSILLFAAILLWWSISPEGHEEAPFNWKLVIDRRNWGVGNPTVSMVITVVTATVAVVTFMHEMAKP